MDNSTPQPPLETLKIDSISKVLARSWEIYRGNLKAILIATILIYLPLDFIISGLGEVVGIEEDVRNLANYIRIISLLEGLVGILVSIAIVLITKAAVEGHPLGGITALSKALLKWPAVVGTNFLVGIATVGLLLLLVVPGIIYAVYWFFALYAILFHGKTGLDAMKYSKTLVQGRWWKVFGYLMVFGLMVLLCYVVIITLSLFFPEHLLNNVAADLTMDIVTSYFMVVGTVFFLTLDATMPKEKSLEI